MLSENLLMHRKNLRLSQEELAGRLGVSRQAYAKWESGETTPELKTCLALAALYEITLDELVNDPFSTKEGPVGKYCFGVVTVTEAGHMVLPTEAMETMKIYPGDKYLLLGDIKNGLAMVPYGDYEQFARKILEAGENA